MNKSTVAAYRAHRTMIVKQLANASATVRRELKRKIAVYDRTIRALG